MKVVGFVLWLLYAVSASGVVFALTPDAPSNFECACIGGFSAAVASFLMKAGEG